MTAPRKSDPCHVVNRGCLAPPCLASSFTRAKCFRCGEATCTACSMRTNYNKYGVRRLCDNCIEELDR